jgi:hypothetical protein
MHRSNQPSTIRVRIEARRADHPDRSTTGKDKPEKEGQQSSTRLDRTGLLIEGTGWSVAAGVRHGARALEESVVIEVFAPVREDYLP